jgi:hypothetical protein
MRTFWGGDCHGLEGSATEGFLPGQSGNPGGRPKRVTKLIETIQRRSS